MAAFLIFDVVAVHDPELYAIFREAVPPTIAAAGGTYLVRGGDPELIQGDWRPNRMIAVRFRSADEARRWWNHQDYAQLKAMLQRSTKTNIILVEGVPNA